MQSGWPIQARGNRDLPIDWLRGLAMACVIVNHSRLQSVFSWFSYERFWVVTAAEVFVVLSGVVLGMVYGRRLARDGWRAVVRGLGRRALLLYAAFVGVTLSVLLLALAGVDVESVTTWDPTAAEWFIDPRLMQPGDWLDVALMRSAPWAFEIVGLYVWLVVAAIPCLLVLRRQGGWRPLLAVSWLLYLSYRLMPMHLTSAEFESFFPILAWQLLFVHGITIGFHRNQIGAVVGRYPRVFPIGLAGATAAFAVFALCNPWANGPSWLHWSVVSPERFTELYTRYFGLEDLGIGRLLNLAVALPLGYAVLTWCWTIARPVQSVLVTLGQRSLGAFGLHVYGILLLAHLPHADDIWINTLLQVVLIVAVAALLSGAQRVRLNQQRARVIPREQPMAA